MKVFSSLMMSQAAADPDDQVHRVWFEEQAEIGLVYNTMKSNCAARGAIISDTVGFPAFFRNQAEYDNFLSTVSVNPFYLGYEQQNGDNNQWLNADGTEVTFTDWNSSQPDNAGHACVVTNYPGRTLWHDFTCEDNDFGIKFGYACRFETTTTADEDGVRNSGESGCDGQPLFEISCDKRQNEDGRNFQILMNVECVQEKHPIIQGVGDFVNKYNTSSETCNFNENTGIAAFDFTDLNCLDVQYSSADNGTEPDQIEYIVTFEKQVPQTLVDQFNLTSVQIAYSFSCVGPKYADVNLDGIIVPGVIVESTAEQITGPTPSPPSLSEVPEGGLPAGDTVELDFSQSFVNFGQYRVDSCEVNGSPFIENGCLRDGGWNLLGFKIDELAKEITVGAIATSESTTMNIQCAVIFCKECEDKISDCPARGNKEIIDDEDGASTRSLNNGNQNSVSQEIRVLQPENPVTISMGGIELIVDMAQVEGTELEEKIVTPELPGIESSAAEATIQLFLMLLLLFFFKK